MFIKLFSIFALIHTCLGILPRPPVRIPPKTPLGAPARGTPKITLMEFNNAVTLNGFRKPSPDIYREFVKATQNFTRPELAMFLTHVIYQSSGFTFREEIFCSTGNQCANRYLDKVGLPGKSYYGRGFMKIAWGANYKSAGQDLGLGDLLLKNPELVARNTKYAVLTSVWYWNVKVAPQHRARPNHFGVTTKAIDGGTDCLPGMHEKADMRYMVYEKVASVMKIPLKAGPQGCYN